MNIINKVHQYLQQGRLWYQRNQNGIAIITVHHTANTQTNDDETALQRVYNAHVGQGWPGFAYHFFIPKSGNIYQLNKFEDVTWHDGHNWDSIGVCLDGYFHSPHSEHPTTEQLKSLKQLLDWLCTKNPQFPANQQDVFGHRERLATACPGDTFFWKVQKYRETGGAYDFINEGNQQPDDQCKEYKDKASNLLEIEKDLKKQVEKLAKEKDECKNEASELERELKERTEIVKSLNELINKNNSTISTLNEKISNLESTVLEKDQRILSLQEQAKKVPELEKQINYLEERKKLWNTAEDKYKKQIKSLESTSYKTAKTSVLFAEIGKRLLQVNQS